MFDYIRTWWLINRISKNTLKLQAQGRDANRVTGNLGKIAYTLDLEEFLDKRTEKYFFYLGKILPKKWRDMRSEKDRKLLQRSNSLATPLTQSGETKSGVIIGTLPEGDYFAKPMNGLAGFLKTYKEAFVTIIAVFAFLASWSPTAKQWISKEWNNLVQHNQPSKQIPQPTQHQSK